ncbi:MAG TPA: MmgE/PrpD family protein [Burkholderiales bacterium]|nr:MmgE/PrpD family protein [Burkholderiales bacterium]
MTTAGHSAQLGKWYLGLKFEDLPPDVVTRVKAHVLDILGLALAGAARDPGRSVRQAVQALGSGNECHVLGYGDKNSALLAAIANGTLAHTMEFDDTHNESITHVANSVITTALTLGEQRGLSGRAAITAIAGGNELSCRMGVVVPGALHKVGYHATGVIGTMSASFVASRLLGLDLPQLGNAVGIAGSQAAGIMECWADGTWSKFLHPGLAAHNGIIAANLAKAGFTGPATVLEGRFGLYKSHIQDSTRQPDFERMLSNLGEKWESRDISFKPYPTAHFIHSFLDALLYLVHNEGLKPGDVKSVMCPIAHYMVPIVCEPVEEKIKPASDWHGRVSLQYSMAEALYHGQLSGRGYAPESLNNPEILKLAQKFGYRVDPEAPGHEQFKGWVIVETNDGRRLERVEMYNRGSSKLPMSDADIRAKFRDNASLMLDAPRIAKIEKCVDGLEHLGNVGELVALCCQ